MYFTPSILELAGFHNKRTALLVAMLPAGVNAAGTVVGAFAIDRAGRRSASDAHALHWKPMLVQEFTGVTV